MGQIVIGVVKVALDDGSFYGTDTEKRFSFCSFGCCGGTVMFIYYSVRLNLLRLTSLLYG